MNIHQIDIKCPICEKTFSAYTLISNSVFGPMNLDTRLNDYSLPFNIIKCPNCGFIISDDEEDDYVNEWDEITSEIELSDPFDFESYYPSERYYDMSKIQKYKHNLIDSYYCIMNAYWLCEDEYKQRQERFEELRNELIEMTPKVLEQLNDENEICTFELRLVDLLRRSGRFQEAIELAKKYIDSKNKLSSCVAKYQIMLCEEKDTLIHNVDEAEENAGKVNSNNIG